MSKVDTGLLNGPAFRKFHLEKLSKKLPVAKRGFRRELPKDFLLRAALPGYNFVAFLFADFFRIFKVCTVASLNFN